MLALKRRETVRETITRFEEKNGGKVVEEKSDNGNNIFNYVISFINSKVVMMLLIVWTGKTEIWGSIDI